MKTKVIWLTGLPCSGKTTIAKALAEKFKESKIDFHILDGDEIRNSHISAGVGFTPKGREMHLLRVAEIAKILLDHNITVVCAFESPSALVRNKIRKMIGVNFFEIFIECDPNICQYRDVKGMWKKAIRGEIKNFTGIDGKYDRPENAEFAVNTGNEMLQETTKKIWEKLIDN